MKKVIIGLSGIVILAVVVILFTNSRTTPQDTKKPATEMSKDCGKCPSAATCTKMTETKGPSITATAATTCDPAKCKAAGCDMTKCKEGKCDPATCKAKCAESKTEMKDCDPAKCPMHAAAKK
jgi:hypothetical protein